MNKFKKLIISILIILLAFLIIELGTYCIESHRLIKEGYRFTNEKNIPPYPTNIITFSEYYFNFFNKEEMINNISGKEYKTPSILIFGDVFVNSFDNNNDTFANKISQITKLRYTIWGNRAGVFLTCIFY